MLRGIKTKTVTYDDGRQAEVIFAQTPELARQKPEPETSGAATIESTANMNQFYGFQLTHAEKGDCGALDPRSYIIEDDIICDQDVAIVMPDGVRLYADIYRPVTTKPVPVIMCWSLYGKKQVRIMPYGGKWVICGCPEDTVSPYTKFEAADPLYWCRNDYAICNIDTRGAFNAEGDMHIWDSQDAYDAYHVIEWLAEQTWCNGKVGLFGNSFLGISQWNIASKNPPHLACIAPWDATSDIYREQICQGGIPARFGTAFVAYKSLGKNYVECPNLMLEKEPYYHNCAYWEDKRFAVEKIDIPVYCVSGWTGIHLRGTVCAFERLTTPKRWIRFHRDWEWSDNYNPENLEDLKRFYDRYLKGIRNGWEMTPRVRLDVMDAYDYDYQKKRGETNYPLERTEYQKLYLNAADNGLSFAPVEAVSKTSYDGKTGEAHFDITFDEDIEITGHMKLKMWVECDGYRDMDLFVTVEKLSTTGEFLPLYYLDHEHYGNTSPDTMKMWGPVAVLDAAHPGCLGRMRVSRRKLSEELSTDYWPVQEHSCDEYLNPGEIVPVEIELWPTSRIWHKGQSLRVTVSGIYKRDRFTFPEGPEIDNQGIHIIHTGGEYDSYLQIPVIPPRYQDGDYVYR